MTPSPVGGSIHLALQQGGADLRPGDTVVLHVIKALDAGKWAVGIAGRVYPASSPLSLEPGMALRARASFSMGRLVLTVSDVVPDAVNVALRAAGLPTGGAEEMVARALARAGLPILTETIQKVKSLLSRSEIDPRRGARLAASLVDKRIDPSIPGADALLRVLAFGEKGGEDPRRYRGRPLPDTSRGLKDFLSSIAAEPGDRPSILQAYNHASGRSQTWVVIPFVFSADGESLAGTLRILYDPHQGRPLALSLLCAGVAFHLPLQGKRRRLSIFCDSEALRRAATRGLDSLKAKFHNMGLEVDDIVKEGNAFDGFSPVDEGEILPSVDTVG